MHLRRVSFVAAPLALAVGLIVGATNPTVAVAATHPAAVASTTTVTTTTTTASATIQVTYHGFPADAQAAVQRAATRWGTYVTSSVPISIDVTWTPLATGVLGSGSADAYYADFVHAPIAHTAYPSALANKLAGVDLAPTHTDITAVFNSAYTQWWFGKGQTPVHQEDLATIAMREIAHGLGFGGFASVTGSTATLSRGGLHSVYDLYTATKSGTALTSLADPSPALKAQLTGGGIVFDSPQLRAVFNNKAARLYAPSTFVAGTSYNLLDETLYPLGSANSLMTPVIQQGEARLIEGTILKAVLTTIGW